MTSETLEVNSQSLPSKDTLPITTRLRFGFRALAILFYAFAGVNHFWHPAIYLQIMPPGLPFPVWMNWISGAAEVLLALMLLVPCLCRLASVGLILLLLAVFPVHIHMALHPELFPRIPVWVLYGRLPLQGVLMLWAWWIRE